eukprot:sb/3473446/
MYNMASWESQWDTHGGDAWKLWEGEHFQIIPNSARDTDVFLLLTAVNCRDSFEKIETEWLPDLKLIFPRVPVILVGSKVDLRDENSVSFEEGRHLAAKIGAACYMTCSSKYDIGVTEIFEEAIKIGAEYQAREAQLSLVQSKKKKSKCNLL